MANATRRKSPRAGVAFGIVGIALAAAACGGAPPVARAFGSTELEPIRDTTLSLGAQSSQAGLTYSTGGGASGAPMVWWTLDLTTGAVQSDGASMPPYVGYRPSPSTPPPYTCNMTSISGYPFTLQIVDTTTNVETDVPEVVAAANCPGADGTLTAFVLDASGGIVLESGPYTQLEPVELTVGVLAVVSWNGATTTSPPTSVTVLAAPVTAPDQDELDSIDLSTSYYEVTTVVPAVPSSVAWATGATPVGSLQSTSLAGSASSVQPLDGHYFYPRSMSEGGTTLFVGPFASGAASELALFELPAGTPLPDAARLGLSPGSPVLPRRYLLTWPPLNGVASTTSSLTVWDDTDLALVVCPSAPDLSLEGVWSSDQSKVLFAQWQGSSGYYGTGGPLDLLTLGAPGGAPTCQQLVSDSVMTAGFSPDNDFMYWLVQPPTGPSQLWLAASDGSGAHMLPLSGEIEGLHFIAGEGARLELILGGELDWLDLHDVTGAFHHVAEQVHGILDLAEGPWLLMSYQWNATDGTGTLALVNRDDGTVRAISPSVAQFEALIEGAGADGGLVDPYGDAGVSIEYLVVYLVRGRNPSAQDGIWRATITPSELQ